MRVAILDDIHDAYGQTAGVRRLRDRIGPSNVEIFTRPFGPPHALAGFDALVAAEGVAAAHVDRVVGTDMGSITGPDREPAS